MMGESFLSEGEEAPRNNRSKSFESAGDLQLARPPRSVSVMPGWDTILTDTFAPFSDQNNVQEPRSSNHTTVRRL
jgi:hypothetical protein